MRGKKKEKMAPKYVDLTQGAFLAGPPVAKQEPSNPYATWDPAELNKDTRGAINAATAQAAEQFKRKRNRNSPSPSYR